MKSKKRQPLFRKIVLPLLIVMLVQAISMVSSVSLNGISGKLRNNAVKLLHQDVEKRYTTLANSMVERWTGFSSSYHEIQSKISSFLRERGRSAKQLGTDTRLTEQLSTVLTEDLLNILRKNEVTGVYFIYTGALGGEYPEQDTQLGGLYFRDSDPISNPQDYSDVLMCRGPAEISGSAQIPLSSYWSYWITYQAGEMEAMDFLFQPYFGALQNPQIEDLNLGYWTNHFTIGDEGEEVLSYSVPVTQDGNCYGVLGIELTKSYLERILPSRELDENGRAGYMLISYPSSQEEALTAQIRMVFGGAASSILSVGEIVDMKIQQETETPIYAVSGKKMLDENVYASVEPMTLYNTNTPFAGERWALAGIKNEDALFGLAYNLEWSMGAAILLCMLIGIIGIYLVALYITKPLQSIVLQLKESDPNQEIVLMPSSIREVDEMSDAVKLLSHQQHLIEEDLMAEQERYRLVLEGTTESVMEYKVAEKELYIYRFQDTGEQAHIETEILDMKRLRVARNDRTIERRAYEQFERFLSGEQKEVFTLEYCDRESGKLKWSEIRGRYVYDRDGRLIRVIGSARDVTDMILARQEEEKRRQKDKTTGFYLETSAQAALAEYLQTVDISCPYGFLFLRLKNVRRIIRRFGVLYGETLVEEAALRTKRCFPEETLLIRAGFVEFIVCLRRTDARQILDCIHALHRDLEKMDTGDPENPRVQLAVGYTLETEILPYEELLSRSGTAMNRAENGQGYSYQTLDQESGGSYGRENLTAMIYSADFSGDMINYAFHLFENSNYIKSTVPLLIRRIGRKFGIDRILVFSVDPDFCTVRCEYQWQREGLSPSEMAIRHFTREQMREIVNYGEQEVIYWKQGEDLGKVPVKLYPPQLSSILYSFAFENGQLRQCVLFEAEEETGAEIQKELTELSKIIATQISRSQADLASKAKSEFLSRMSHEIRTPMNAIMGMTSIAMKEMEEPDKVKDCLEKIDVSTQYLMTLINDILDMSKIESGKMKLEYYPYSAAEQLERLRVLIQPQTQSKDITFEIESDVEDCWYYGDALRMNQVLVNLLGNAVKFTPAGGRIQLTVKEISRDSENALLYFSVRDTGIGISPENLSRIFRAFEQAEEDTARKFGGTGLGLSISSSLLNLMGSKLEVRSELGKGTEFYFTIQQKTADPTDVQPVSEFQEEISDSAEFLKGCRILLVEDNDLNIEIAKTILEMHGMRVDVAVNGQEGVSRFRDSEPGEYQLILMDINMPVMDGLEATRIIRKLDRKDSQTVPIIAMSANAFDEDMQKSIESGMNGHLSKPFRPEQLIDLMKKFVAPPGKNERP